VRIPDSTYQLLHGSVTTHPVADPSPGILYRIPDV